MSAHVAGVDSSKGRGVSVTRTVLWAASVRTKGLQERLTAAGLAGFSHISVFPVDMKIWRDQGLNDGQIAQAARDAGLQTLTIDPFVQWMPGFDLSRYPNPSDRAFVEHDEASVFAMAEALGAPQINLVSNERATLDIDATAKALHDVAGRANARGFKLTLEFMPIGNIPDLQTALAVLDKADADNVGLTFDTWHFYRSDPDHALLETVEGSRIIEVQLADAALRIQGTMLNDLQHYRRVPGEGDFDLDHTVRVLKDIGAWRSVGPEIFSDEMDALQAGDAAARARQGLDRFQQSRLN